MAQLLIHNIHKSYKQKKVLTGVSCRLSQGEIVGLFGPNGAGKTTLFSIIVGLLKPCHGQIFLDNEDITKLPIYMRGKLGFGYLPQDISIFKKLTVEDNIKAILEIISTDRQFIEQRCSELLAEFSIEHLRNNMAQFLSGGERRRLEIARTLATNPKFVFLDEPLAGVDPIAVKEIKTLVSYLKHKNIGILVTDHNVRDTLDIVDRSYIMYNGQVLVEGNAADIINSAKARNVYLGDDFTAK